MTLPLIRVLSRAPQILASILTVLMWLIHRRRKRDR